jgi:hypothetical protein
LNEIADYGVGHSAGVTVAQAEQAIETARQFIDFISGLLSAPKPTSRKRQRRKTRLIVIFPNMGFA